MRRQLIATTALIALAAILVLGIPLGLVESARARGDALGRLEREADGIAAAADDRAVNRPQLDARTLSPWLRPGHAAVVSSGATSVQVGSKPKGRLLSARSGATQGVRVTVFASAGEITRRRRQVWLLVGGLAIVGTAAAAALALLQARRFVRPLQRLAATSARLGAGDFSARAGRLGFSELDLVAASLDAAAVQIAQLVGRQREFSANVSHQLRTPLTAMILRLDELATLEDPAAAREEIEATLRVADRLEQTVTDLLALARAGDIGQPRDVDLAEIARRHADDWQPIYQRAGRRLRLTVEPVVPARVSPGGVAQALDVLLENALNHGAGETTLQASLVEGRGVLAVEDEGAGLPEGLERAIFERDVSTAGSTGLGLPLARALVEADGGRLMLTRPRPARFEIVLPRSRRPD
jgi:signal transduction histidine kinase